MNKIYITVAVLLVIFTATIIVAISHNKAATAPIENESIEEVTTTTDVQEEETNQEEEYIVPTDGKTEDGNIDFSTICYQTYTPIDQNADPNYEKGDPGYETVVPEKCQDGSDFQEIYILAPGVLPPTYINSSEHGYFSLINTTDSATVTVDGEEYVLNSDSPTVIVPLEGNEIIEVESTNEDGVAYYTGYVSVSDEDGKQWQYDVNSPGVEIDDPTPVF